MWLIENVKLHRWLQLDSNSGDDEMEGGNYASSDEAKVRLMK